MGPGFALCLADLMLPPMCGACLESDSAILPKGSCAGFIHVVFVFLVYQSIEKWGVCSILESSVKERGESEHISSSSQLHHWLPDEPGYIPLSCLYKVRTGVLPEIWRFFSDTISRGGCASKIKNSKTALVSDRIFMKQTSSL